MNFKLSTSVLIFFITFQTIIAQTYVPIDTANFEKRKQISKDYLKKQKEFVKSLKTEFTSSELPYAKKIFKESKDEFNDEILHGDYIFEDSIQGLLNQIVQKLQQANTNIPDKVDFYVSRNITLNAMSMADKSFLMNLGSFYFLENEQQMAALISHEFAHSILKHQFISIKKAYKMETDEARKNLEQVKKSRYGRGARALERFKDMLYSNGKMNRQQEYEADSLGYVLFKNAGYKPTEYLNAFQLMMEYDTIRPKYMDLNIYRKVFEFPGLKFREEWFKMEDFSGYDYTKFKEKYNSDSLKSHPELAERIAKLDTHFQELKQKSESAKPSDWFAAINNLAKYESLSSLDLTEEYGFGVYVCLWRMSGDKAADKAFYEQWLGKYFTKILKARKDYNLNRYLDRVDPRNHSLAYQQFLNFMWNLKISEIEQIAKYYSKAS